MLPRRHVLRRGQYRLDGSRHGRLRRLESRLSRNARYRQLDVDDQQRHLVTGGRVRVGT